MASLTLRSVKGTPLTNSEVDANFSNLNTELATKQATLVSGTSIKTVNGVSVLGSGNIQIDGGVTSFNSRTGAVTLSSVDVTGALGFTPYNATNPSGYVTAAGARGAISVTGAGSYDSATGVINIVGGVTSFNTRTGAITLSSADVTTALGFTPYNNTNPSGYITGITSTMVTTALGYTPYNSSNPNGYISSITSANVTTALGFTPYNATNPSGYITSSALSGYLTSASAASTYLPLSGGTLTGTTYINTGGGYPLQLSSSQRYMLQLRNTGNSINSGYGWWFATDTNFNFAMHADGLGDVLTLTRSGALTLNGNQVLHAGNYSSYSPTLTGTGASGTWGINVTGASRSISLPGQQTEYTILDGPANGPVIKVRYDGATANRYIDIGSKDGNSVYYEGLKIYNGGTPTWGGNTILHAGNYSSYALPLTGGTITGNIIAANNNVGGVFGNLEIGYGGRYNTLQTKTNADTLWLQYGHSGPVGIGYGGGTTTVYGQMISSANGNQLRFVRADGTTPNWTFHGWGGGLNIYSSAVSTLYIGRDGPGTSLDVYNGSLTQAGNQVLHAGNYTSYSPALTGTGASGTWGINVTGTSAKTGANSGYTRVGYGMAAFYNWGGANAGSGAPSDSTYTTGIDVGSHPSDQAYGFQIASNMWNVGLWTRTYNSGFSSWVRILDSSNYSSYALPLSGGELSGSLRINTSGSGSTTSHVIIKRSGQTPASFGSYSGSWRSSLEIWNNDSTKMLFLNSAENDSGYANIKSVGGGFFIDVGSNGATRAIQIEASGAANFPQSLTQGGNQVLHASNWTNYVQLPYTGWPGYPGTDANTFLGGSWVRTSFTYSNNAPLTGTIATFPSSGYDLQLNANYNGHDLYFRSRNGDNASWMSWKRVLNDNNYNSYSPTLTGGNASGSWGISITGTARALDSGHYIYRTGTSGNLNTDFGNIPAGTMRHAGDDANVSNSPGGTWWFYDHYRHSNSSNLWGTQVAWGWEDNSNRLAQRNVSGGNWSGWVYYLNSGNYNSYAPTLTGGNASGTWGINISGNAASASSLASDTSSRFRVITFTGEGYDSGNGSQPTSYGIYQQGGGWSHPYPDLCIGFHTGIKIGAHFSYNGTRFYNNSDWATEIFSVGNGDNNVRVTNTLFVGGNTALHAGNYSSYAGGLSTGNNWTNYNYFVANRNTTSDSPPLQAFSNNGSGAIMSFHRGGYYAVNFGLDSDNVMRIGGWSAGANRWQLDMSGNMTVAGNVTAYSDERLKKDWAAPPADFVKRLAKIKAGTYTRIDSEERQAGVSAQDFQNLLPEAVSEDNEGTLSLAYGNAALVSAVELAKDNVELRARIERLESLINKLIGD